jgi:hypothetical protein
MYALRTYVGFGVCLSVCMQSVLRGPKPDTHTISPMIRNLFFWPHGSQTLGCSHWAPSSTSPPSASPMTLVMMRPPVRPAARRRWRGILVCCLRRAAQFLRFVGVKHM